MVFPLESERAANGDRTQSGAPTEHAFHSRKLTRGHARNVYLLKGGAALEHVFQTFDRPIIAVDAGHVDGLQRCAVAKHGFIGSDAGFAIAIERNRFKLGASGEQEAHILNLPERQSTQICGFQRRHTAEGVIDRITEFTFSLNRNGCDLIVVSRPGPTFKVEAQIGIIRFLVRLDAQRAVVDFPHAAAYCRIFVVIGAEQAPAIVKLFRGIRCRDPIGNSFVTVSRITASIQAIIPRASP